MKSPSRLEQVQRLFHGVPRKCGALHSNRKRADALEDLELAWQYTSPRPHVFGDELVEGFEDLTGFLDTLALDHLRHHRGAGLRDGAALSLEARIDDPIPFHF